MNTFLRSSLIIALFSFNTTLSASHQTDQEHVMTPVAETVKLLNQQGEQLWPTFKINHPTVIQFIYNYFNVTQVDNSYFYAFDFKPNQHWRPITFAGYPGYFNNDEPIHLVYDSQYVWVDDQPSFLFEIGELGVAGEPSLEEVIPYLRFSIGQEHFYDHIIKTFNPSLLEMKAFRNLDHVESILLSYLEVNAWADYLRTFNTENLKDALAINLTKQSLLSAESRDHVEKQEMVLGTLAYFSLKSAAINKNEISNRAKEFSILQTDTDDEPFPYIEEVAEDLPMVSGVSLAFAADDQHIPNWKQTLQTKGIGPRVALNAKFPMAQDEIKKRVARAKQRYNCPALTNQINQQIKAHKTSLDNIRSAYNKSSGIEIELTTIQFPYFDTQLPYNVSVPADSNSSFYKDGSIRFMPENSNIEVSARKLSYFYSEVTWQKLGGNSFNPIENRIFKFKLEPNLQVNIDGQSTTLKLLVAKNNVSSFNTFSISSEELDINFNHPGKIFITGNTLKIVINNDTAPSDDTLHISRMLNLHQAKLKQHNFSSFLHAPTKH